jgi:hypothetical protein
MACAKALGLAHAKVGEGAALGSSCGRPWTVGTAGEACIVFRAELMAAMS